MREPRERCRLVALPSGGTIRLRSEAEPRGEALAAVDDMIQAARRLAEHRAVQDPPDAAAAELYARIRALCDRELLLLREAAKEAGVPPSALSRLTQGRLPEPEIRQRIEAWLARNGADSTITDVKGDSKGGDQ